MSRSTVLGLVALAFPLLVVPVAHAAGAALSPSWMAASRERVLARLVEKHGEGEKARAQQGLAQVAALWREADGGAEDFESLALQHFVAQGAGEGCALRAGRVRLREPGRAHARDGT